tara:strand:+ start:2147 stop:3283 length:1137 start_codon:yes stop_codon:yes gene_type:complete
MEQTPIEEIAGMKVFSNPEDLAASMNSASETTTEAPVEQQEAVVEQPVEQPITEGPPVQESAPVVEEFVQPQAETVETEQYTEPEYSEEDIESAVFSFLSDKLGRNVASLDDLSVAQQTEAKALDERIEAIAKFVEETGRAPEDWFRYQSLNPEGMDDMTAIRIQMANEYPNLSYDELNLLVNSKYKLDPDMYTEEEVTLGKLQLKMDGDKARKGIEDIRGSYSAPAPKEQSASEPESIIDDNWISEMSKEVDALTGLEFDLGDEKTFEFGLDDQYKSQLKNRNARLDEFFDPYVREDGTWDYDLLSSHMAVIDNIDRIVKSAYTRGLGDGQKTLVDTAANVSTETPQQGNQNQQTNPLADQLKNIMGGQSNKLTFKI